MNPNDHKKRRQVSFNIDKTLYTEFKKVMLDKGTTPTAYLTKAIRLAVEEAKRLKGQSSED